MPSPPPPRTLTTPRLRLIPFNNDPSSGRPTDDQCDFIVRLYNTPEFIASIGGEPTSITTREAARPFIERRFLSEYSRNGYGTWIIVWRRGLAGEEEEEMMIGTVSLSRGEKKEGGYGAPDLGFAVLPEFGRKGVATEASRKVLEWYDGEFGGGSSGGGCKPVLGLFNPENEASRGMFRKLGFEDRGKRVLSVFGGVVGEVWTWPAGGLSEEEVRGLGLPAVFVDANDDDEKKGDDEGMRK